MFHSRRCLPIVALITFLVVFVSWMASPNARLRYSFAVTIQSDNSGLFRFFYDAGRGFNEADQQSFAIQHAAEFKTYRYDAPAGKIAAIRYDFPNSVPGTYYIRSVTLLDTDGNVVHDFPVTNFLPNNDIASIAPIPRGSAVTVAPDHLNPYMVQILDQPIIIPGVAHRFLAIGAVVALLAAALAAFLTAWLIKAGHAARLKVLLSRIAARLSIPNFLPLDHVAVAFYLGILFYFLILSAAGLHGSSASIQSTNFQQDHPNITLPLLGQPRGIRVDEWNTHTPAILYQLSRPDTLNVNDGIVGPENATLIACLPAKHWSLVVHPEFWAFFVLPRDTAYAVYWQFKTLLLLAGTFTLLLMLTRSSGLAVFGALWFYYSPYTQWCFSWPTLLPDMIGNCCLATVFACHTLVARSWKSALLSALVATYFGLGFVLLTYPPFQIPFVWIGVAVLAGFIWTRWADIISLPQLAQHLVPFGLMLFLVLAITKLFLINIDDVYKIASATTYPGHRVVPGGLPFARVELLSSFFDLAKKEDHFPLTQLGNICEGTGYYWLAPIALLLLGGMQTGLGFAKRMFFVLWLPLLILVAWMLFPISPEKGHFLLLDMVPPNRALPAIGLLNIIIVLLLLRFRAPPPRPPLSVSTTKPIAVTISLSAIAIGILLLCHGVLGRHLPPRIVNTLEIATIIAAFCLFICQLSRLPADLRNWLLRQLGLLAGTFLVAFTILFGTNAEMDHYFSLPAILCSTLLLTIMIGCLINRLTHILMFVILVPLFVEFAYINPIDRGFPWLDNSDIRALQKSHPLKPGKWLVYSDQWIPAPSFVAAHGIDVFNYFHYIPDLNAMAKFDPTGKFKDAYNQSGYILTFALPPGAPATFHVADFGMLEWHVSPTDPGIAANGIRYLAFYGKPDPTLVPAAQFHPLADHPFDGLWIYERLEP